MTSPPGHQPPPVCCGILIVARKETGQTCSSRRKEGRTIFRSTELATAGSRVARGASYCVLRESNGEQLSSPGQGTRYRLV
jgi:hypothetical protein